MSPRFDALKRFAITRRSARAGRGWTARLLGAALLAAMPPQGASAQTKPAAKPAPVQPMTPAAPPAAAPAAPPPSQSAVSPTHLALAREAMLNSGIARSFDSIIPAFSEQIKKNAVTRPDLAKDLDDVLKKLQPEMEAQKQRMIDTAAGIYAARLSEPELKDIVAFFRSPAGKRYVETQPTVLDEMVGAMQDWTQEVSEYMMVRVRSEMTKRGHQMQ